MLGRFFDTTAVDAFVERAADMLVRLVPPASVDRSDAKSAARRERFDRDLRVEARRLMRDAKPNLYQKAKLGTRLKDTLVARGYPEAFSRELSFDVVKLLATSAADDAPR